MATQEILTRTLVELADNLVDDFDVVDLLTLLTTRCCEVFEVQDAGLMLAAPIGTDLRVVAASSDAMRTLELLELQQNEGPCLDCYHSGQPVPHAELAQASERWPRFSPAALERGYRSVAAVPMRLRGTTIGALNLLRAEPAPLSPDDLAAVQAFADVATIAVLQHQAAIDAQTVNDQLSQALNSRVVIEQAKGMLAERANLDMDQAFVALRKHARSHNLRLADVARDLLGGAITIDPA